MKRRITALMITLCMVLTMMPLHVHATEAGHVHYGGEATCRWKATCEGCGSIYGETDPNNHNDYFGEDNGDGRTHTAMCTCGHIYNASEPHDFSGWEEDGPGQEARFCYECYYTETRSTHTHSYSVATCTTPATCSCNATQGGVDKNNHVGGTEIRDQVDAGEFSDGYTGDTYCLGCGDKISSGSTIPATHAHSWEWTHDSGMHWQKCFGCGESSTAAEAHQFDDDADATCDTCGYTRTVHTHDYTAVVAAPTCSAQGYTTYTCSCGDSYMGDYVDAVDHDWGDWEFNRDGTHTRVCNTDSSHTESGSCEGIYWIYGEREHVKCWKCLVCQGGEVYDGTYDYEHIYDNATDLTCDLCGYVRTVEGNLSITGSMPAATVGEAYSASFGYTGTVSGVVFWNATGLPDGLSINAGSGVVSGTPTAAGTYSITISMGATGGGSASKSFSLTVNEPAHTHSYSIANCQTPATCFCGETTGDVDKSNHVGGTEIRNQVDAGEFTEGYTGDTYCLGCGDKLSSGSSIPATHTHSYNSYDYDRDGHWKVCSCGATQAVEDHDWYIYKQDANKHYWRCDCGNNGWGNDHFDNNNTGKCDDCGYEMPHTHDYTAVVTAPTCKEQGYTTYTCSCNDSYVSDYVDALGHDWGDCVSIGNGRHKLVCGNDSRHEQTTNCGGRATCHELAFCSDCKTTYGEYDQDNHSGGTEVRNAKKATETENGYTGDTYCLGCNVLISEGSIIYATGSGDDDDTHTHNYSYYKFDGTNHWKMCHCGQGQAGSVKPHSLVITGASTGHVEECTVCNYFSDVEAHVYSDDSDAYCNECGYRRHVHDQSTAATCKSPAKCSCGVTTGGKDPTNHTGGTEIRNAVEATRTEKGYTGDTYCLGCDSMIASGEEIPAKGFVAVKIEDDAIVKEVTFITAEGVELPGDAEIIVNPHTPSADNLAYVLGIDADTEYLDADNVKIQIVGDGIYTAPDGTKYSMYEIILINGEEYLITNYMGTGDVLGLMRLSDGATCGYKAAVNVLDFTGSINGTVQDYAYDKVNIGGVTYDVKLSYANAQGTIEVILYYNGSPAAKLRNYEACYFLEGFDPETLKAQQNANDLGTVTTGETPIDGLESGKTYNVSVIGSNDIHLEGAENVSGTVTQTFDIPNELVGKTDVTFVAVHNTNPHATALAAAKYKMEEAIMVYWEYHGDSAEERQRLYEAANRASMEWQIVQEHYDAWEKEHAAATGTGNELGIVTISEDGKTLTATYTVSSFSPFTVYAFTEAELPEIREFVTQPDGTLARAVNGQPVATHTVASGENLTDIARKYGCTVDEIVALNSDLIENPRLIFAGWVLTIPQK